jgi:hypothetical protein
MPMMTPAQRRAIFQAARARDMTVEDVRMLTPRNTVSDLTVREAGQLLDRLNQGTTYARERAPAREAARAPAREKGVFAPIQPAQKILIESIATEVGWSMPQLWAFLEKRHFANDPSRNMKQATSSSDAVAIIELLKRVREKHFTARAREAKTGNRPLPEQDALIESGIRKICDLLHRPAEMIHSWIREQRFPDGRSMGNVASSADASALIETLTKKLKSLGEIPVDSSTEPRRAMP